MTDNTLAQKMRARDMANPECQDGSSLDPIYTKEWADRSWAWMQNMSIGGEVALQQARLDTLGAMLRDKRKEQNRSLGDVARVSNMDPNLLCFLESGWGTVDEYLAHIDQWADVLGEVSSLLSESFLFEEKK